MWWILVFAFAFYVGEGEKRFKTLPSSIAGYDLGNIHYLDKEKLRIRGASPEESIKELQRLGVKKILIVKKQSHDEVDREIIRLKKAGYKGEDILHIPLPWRGIQDFSKQCRNVLKAVKALAQAKEKTFLHCTVGEDRTGLVSGLYQVHFEKKNPYEVFNREMCQKGYGHANKSKPMWVADFVHENLSPIYYYLAMVKELKPSLCELIDPQKILKSEGFKRFKCERSIVDV